VIGRNARLVGRQLRSFTASSPREKLPIVRFLGWMASPFTLLGIEGGQKQVYLAIGSDTGEWTTIDRCVSNPYPKREAEAEAEATGRLLLQKVGVSMLLGQ